MDHGAEVRLPRSRYNYSNTKLQELFMIYKFEPSKAFPNLHLSTTTEYNNLTSIYNSKVVNRYVKYFLYFTWAACFIIEFYYSLIGRVLYSLIDRVLYRLIDIFIW